MVPISRIYNRVIPDELDRKGIELPFDYRDELDVEWAGHPAGIPHQQVLDSVAAPPGVPRTWFLHKLDELPGRSRELRAQAALLVRRRRHHLCVLPTPTSRPSPRRSG